MTCKQVNNDPNDATKTSQNRKNQDKVIQKLRPCSQFSSIIVVWCSLISFRRVKQRIRDTIWALWSVCERVFVKRGRICGNTNLGFCTTIMHHLAKLPLCANFWPKTQLIWSNKYRIHQIWFPVTFSCFLNSNCHFGTRFESIKAIKENSSWSQPRPIKNVLIIGLIVGINLLLRKGTSLRAIKQILMINLNVLFYWEIPSRRLTETLFS